MIGSPGIMRDDPDWFPAVVADYIFGSGSFSSRLMNEVREKRGLAYTVQSSLVPYDAGAIMVVSAGTRADQSELSLSVIREEFAKMRNPGVTQQELDGAKQYLVGAWPLRFTTTGKVAQLLVEVQHDHLGLDYLDRRNKLIQAVTLADVQRVSKRLYNPDVLTTVIVGPDVPQGPPPKVNTAPTPKQPAEPRE
jgi:zinc protease